MDAPHTHYLTGIPYIQDGDHRRYIINPLLLRTYNGDHLFDDNNDLFLLFRGKLSSSMVVYLDGKVSTLPIPIKIPYFLRVYHPYGMDKSVVLTPSDRMRKVTFTHPPSDEREAMMITLYGLCKRDPTRRLVREFARIMTKRLYGRVYTIEEILTKTPPNLSQSLQHTRLKSIGTLEGVIHNVLGDVDEKCPEEFRVYDSDDHNIIFTNDAIIHFQARAWEFTTNTFSLRAIITTDRLFDVTDAIVGLCLSMKRLSYSSNPMRVCDGIGKCFVEVSRMIPVPMYVCGCMKIAGYVYLMSMGQNGWRISMEGVEVISEEDRMLKGKRSLYSQSSVPIPIIKYFPSKFIKSITLETSIHTTKSPDVGYVKWELHISDLEMGLLRKWNDFDVLSNPSHPTFPYLRRILPSFDEMFERLKGWEDDSDGPLVRKWPSDYLLMDGISNHLTEIPRMKCRKMGRVSPIEVWESLPNKDHSPLEANDIVYEYTCNHFNPAYAKWIIMKTVGRGARIIDPSGGWLDRVLAAVASGCIEYRGTDPNLDLQLPFMRMKGMLNVDYVTLLPEVFEYSQPEKEKYDLGLTSPPYYVFEEYTHSEKDKAMSYEEWLDRVYKKYLHVLYESIKFGGWIVLYVENFSHQRITYPLRDDTTHIYGTYQDLVPHDPFSLVVENTSLPSSKKSIRGALVWRKEERILPLNEPQFNASPGSKFRFFFPLKNAKGIPLDKEYEHLRMMPNSRFSTTPAIEANKILTFILRTIRSHPHTLTITDATANIGGDTFAFLSAGFKKVNSVEIDELTASVLKRNLEVLGYTTSGVVCGDYTKIHHTITQDIVYIDAPWGGKDYKLLVGMELFMSGMNVKDLVKCVRAKYIFLKVPLNYSRDGLKVSNEYTIQRPYWDKSSSTRKFRDAYKVLCIKK